MALGNDYMNYDYKSSHCGRRVQVRNTGANYRVGGKGNVIEVVVADTCASCHGNHIDFSHAAWDELTDESDHGQINLEWYDLPVPFSKLGLRDIAKLCYRAFLD